MTSKRQFLNADKRLADAAKALRITSDRIDYSYEAAFKDLQNDHPALLKDWDPASQDGAYQEEHGSKEEGKGNIKANVKSFDEAVILVSKRDYISGLSAIERAKEEFPQLYKEFFSGISA